MENQEVFRIVIKKVERAESIILLDRELTRDLLDDILAVLNKSLSSAEDGVPVERQESIVKLIESAEKKNEHKEIEQKFSEVISKSLK